MERNKELIEQLQKNLRESGDLFGAHVLVEDAADGDKIPKAHLTAIAKLTQKELPPESIHTYPVLMIDDQPTRNMVIYTAESQKKSAKGWVGTTFLFNAKGTSPGFWSSGADHTLQAASQIARIYKAQVVKTPKGNIGTLGWFYTVEGIDDHVDSFIKKLDAGILKEVSIHVQVPEGVLCSICNDAFSKCMDNAGAYHYPGEKYGKEMCYMSTGTGVLVPLELSAVACPGSPAAHVMASDDVEDYTPVSLREALGGSRETISQIRQENSAMNEAEKLAEARNRLKAAATAAGVTLAEFVADKANKTLAEEAQVTPKNVATVFSEGKTKCAECGHSAHGDGTECAFKNCECMGECAECGHESHGTECDESGCSCDGGKAEDDEEEKNDPDNQDPPESKEGVSPVAIFEGSCPVCLRTGTESAGTENPSKLRTEMQAAVNNVVAEANKKIAAANTRAEAGDKAKAERDAMFADLIEDTANRAVEKGVEKESNRLAYLETLKNLSYEGVKAIRVTLAAVPAPKESAARETLATRMSERFKNAVGKTTVVETADGRKVAQTNRRPGFAAKAK